MRRIALGFLAGSSFVLMGSMAFAADLQRPVLKAPPPPPAPVFSWTGFYVGGHVGGAWGTSETDLNSISFSCGRDVTTATLLFVNGFCNGSTHTVNGFSVPISQTQENGFLGGVQGGYNWQFNSWGVLGVEAQWSWTDLKGTSPCVFLLACETKHDWLGTVAGRVGVTYDRALFYLKGGVAWTRVNYSATLNLDGVGSFSTSASDTRVGAMFGAGVEYAFLPNWSAKIEYDYMDFGSRDYDFPLSIPQLNNLNLDFHTSIHERVHLVKAGVNYRFDWGGPVAARY